MNIVAKYREVKQGFRIEVNGTLMWETKTVEAAEGLTKLLNEKLADAYLEGHDDASHGIMNVDNYDDLDDPGHDTFDEDFEDIDEREFDV
jgi:hypothetical protein